MNFQSKLTEIKLCPLISLTNAHEHKRVAIIYMDCKREINKRVIIS